MKKIEETKGTEFLGYDERNNTPRPKKTRISDSIPRLLTGRRLTQMQIDDLTQNQMEIDVTDLSIDEVDAQDVAFKQVGIVFSIDVLFGFFFSFS